MYYKEVREKQPREHMVKTLEDLSLFISGDFQIFIDEDTAECYPTVRTIVNLCNTYSRVPLETIQGFLKAKFHGGEQYEAFIKLGTYYHIPVLTVRQALLVLFRYGATTHILNMMAYKGANQYFQYLVEYGHLEDIEDYRKLEAELKKITVDY